jgi:hypothetical protein
MRRSVPNHASRQNLRQFGLLALVLATGCAHLDADFADRLGQRVIPVEVDAGRSTNKPQAKVSNLATTTPSTRSPRTVSQ